MIEPFNEPQTSAQTVQDTVLNAPSAPKDKTFAEALYGK